MTRPGAERIVASTIRDSVTVESCRVAATSERRQVLPLAPRDGEVEQIPVTGGQVDAGTTDLDRVTHERRIVVRLGIGGGEVDTAVTDVAVPWAPTVAGFAWMNSPLSLIRTSSTGGVGVAVARVVHQL